MRREILYVIIFFSLLAFAFFNPAKYNTAVSLIGSGARSTDKEETFAEPLNIIWKGKIIATMSGGACIGVEGLTAQAGTADKYSKFMACLSDGHSNGLWNYSGDVTILGKWLGITCSYKNTIFGECVPDVVIENIQ